MDQDHVHIPQELVNHIINFLHDTRTDLKACALVSRAFVYAAQSHIFTELSISRYRATTSEIDALWSRCQATLHASPHLVQHIHRFKLHPRQMSIDTLSAICTFPFTHLKEVCIRDFTPSPPFAIALQQLFSLPSLRLVSLECWYNDPWTFMQIWDRCAPGLKHLELKCSQKSNKAFHPTSHRWPTPIRLDSLRIRRVMDRGIGMRDWMDHAFCPFDFSALRVLSISSFTEVLRWSKLGPCLRTLEALDFTASTYDDPMIDLSTFPCLVVLRISIDRDFAWPMVLDTLSTIAPSNHIRKIVICGVFADGIAAEELDSRLSSLPMHHSPTFHLEMDPDEYDRCAATLHRLSSTNMLRRAEPHHGDWGDWFQSYTRTL
ncbi:hypothetical protein DFH09DRAFT_1164680 [Mycena vulgaris]|nr:hypothetical protein DFH09DRAFT_1164680 [Mycena vulgaris]